MNLVTFEQFERFYRSLRFRPEIAELFSSLCLTDQSYISLAEFSEFVTGTQHENWDNKRCQDSFTKFSLNERMDLDHFSSFLMSSRNSLSSKLVSQDLKQPFCNYFVNSSHNTYLLSDQLVGTSSVEGYIRALQRGCRCVELDCWDGPLGNPVIYHGRTLYESP